MTDVVAILQNATVPAVPMSGVALVGPKGDPGGNIMAIGLFGDAPSLSIPTGTDSIRTSGYAAAGKGAAFYIADASIDAAYVAANPRTSFISSNGRGFRLSGGKYIEATQLGAMCDSGADGVGGTDDTIAMNAAIAYLVGLGGGSIFIDGHCRCSGALDLSGRHNIALVGHAGQGAGYSYAPPSQLIFSGTGAGRFIDARSSFGITLINLGIRYTSSSFTGMLIDFQHSSGNDACFGLVERCLVWGIGVHSAARLINLDAAILCSVVDCHLAWGQIGIGGINLPGFSNAHNITRCTFANLSVSAIVNAGEAWTVQGCWFEGTNGGFGGMPRAYYDNQPAGQSVTRGLSWIGNWHGDGIAVADAWFCNGATEMYGLNISGGNWDNGFNTSGSSIKLTARITGGSISGTKLSYIDLANVGHSGLVISGNFFVGDVQNVNPDSLDLWIFANFGGVLAKTIIQISHPSTMQFGNVGDTAFFASLDGIAQISHDVAHAPPELRLGYSALGFYDQTPDPGPVTISGSTQNNAALQSLLVNLANMGLIVNSTTA